jgi:hypothetical protein
MAARNEALAASRGWRRFDKFGSMREEVAWWRLTTGEGEPVADGVRIAPEEGGEVICGGKVDTSDAMCAALEVSMMMRRRGSCRCRCR